MTGKFSRRQRRGGEGRRRNGLFEIETSLSMEKKKARDLRHSSWWKEIIARGTCYYCGKTCRPDELTMDHKIPLSAGGKSEKINIVAACKECNNRKKYMLPTEWDVYLKMMKQTSGEK